MGHSSLTCIFTNVMQPSSSIATANGTQIWSYHKTIKDQPWWTLSPRCWIPRFSLKAFLVQEKKIFKFFLPYIGMAAILFNDAEPFEQSINVTSTEGPLWNLVKIGQVV